MQVELSKDELHMIRYALQEMGGRRTEQAIERKNESLRTEAKLHFKLAEKLSDYLRQQ